MRYDSSRFSPGMTCGNAAVRERSLMLAPRGLTAAQPAGVIPAVTCMRAAPRVPGTTGPLARTARGTFSTADSNQLSRAGSRICAGQDAWLRAVSLPPRHWRTGTPWIMDLSRNSLHRSYPRSLTPPAAARIQPLRQGAGGSCSAPSRA